jgi:hypothetical protein
MRQAARSVRKIPGDLALSVDANQICAEAARKIDRRVDAAIVEKAAVRATITPKVKADDFTVGIDRSGAALRCAGHIQNGVVAMAIKKAVIIPVVNIAIGPDDLPLVVDACKVGEIAARRIDCSVDTMAIKEGLLACIACKVKSDDLSLGVNTIGY